MAVKLTHFCHSSPIAFRTASRCLMLRSFILISFERARPTSSTWMSSCMLADISRTEWSGTPR